LIGVSARRSRRAIRQRRPKWMNVGMTIVHTEAMMKISMLSRMTGIILLGYFLGNIPVIRDNIEIFIIASVCTIVIPTFIHFGRRWRIARRDRRAETPIKHFVFDCRFGFRDRF
jgi:hypothetical protein